MHFQDLILKLQHYWNQQGCLIVQPYDLEKGAGTFSPATFLRSQGPEPFAAAYVEPCRRPTDGRYGENPIRMQHYYQFQVIMKPNPPNILDLYLGSLSAIGIDPHDHDIRFVHDDWESPTLGAWGLGWEVWVDGMEITQFTYFQQVGGMELDMICGEITYGLERICMFLQNVDNVFDLKYNEYFRYGDLFHQNEVEQSKYNFELADVEMYRTLFQMNVQECRRLCEAGLPLPAADYCLKASHAFNMLDARGAISVNERQNYILQVRSLAKSVSEVWLQVRSQMGHPLQHRLPVSNSLSTPSSSAKHHLSSSSVPTLQEKEPLLIELGVEEMPARVFQPLREQLPTCFEAIFSTARISTEGVHFALTPRRIVIAVDAITTKQPDEVQYIKGPSLTVARDQQGRWTPAAEGFVKKNGVTLDDLEIREEGKNRYVYIRKTIQGRSVVEILPELIKNLFDRLHWYKTMRWETYSTRFVRPIRWLCVKLGDYILPMSYGHVANTGTVCGHRFLAPQLVEVPTRYHDYLQTMRNHYVIVDHEERKALIRSQIHQLAQQHQVVWVEDEELLDEVTFLTEYPVAILQHFDPGYLEIPPQVIISEMKTHQRYFACRSLDGNLTNAFIAVSNMQCSDMKRVGVGYEKVLRSRLEDAKFFVAEDRKIKLKDRVPKLAGITYHARLGTMLEKVQRIQRLANQIAQELQLSTSQKQIVEQIALLCKADLTTHMVYEFPELQGSIGSYYAQQEGLPQPIVEGIQEHYLPQNSSEKVPNHVESMVVALADRIDTLVAFSAVEKLPSGSADPFGLRRACLTSIAIILTHRFNLDFAHLLSLAIDQLQEKIPSEKRKTLLSELLEFTQTRLRRLLHDGNLHAYPISFPYEQIDAVLAASSPWTQLYDMMERLLALHHFLAQSETENRGLMETFKRCHNILAKNKDAEATFCSSKVDPSLFEHSSEEGLWDLIQKHEKQIHELFQQHQYLTILKMIPQFKKPVDTFFDSVLVNTEDQARRSNRQYLIYKIVSLVKQIADLSYLPG